MKKMLYKYNKIYALNNIDSEKLDKNSDFLIGSISKLYTIIVLLILNKNGIIDFKKKLVYYLKGTINSNLYNIKIIDIVNHVSGMKAKSDSKKKFCVFKYESSTDVYNTYKDENLITLEKGKYSYSNIGYMILGVLIEKVTGKNYKDVFDELIFKPLSLENTNFNETKITLYNSKEEKLNEAEKNERTYACNAGGLKSSINDSIKFAQFPILLNTKCLNILKKMYVFSENTDFYTIQHEGAIKGGIAFLLLNYNKDWTFNSSFFECSTIVN